MSIHVLLLWFLMAITQASLTSGKDDDGSATAVTASISPTANRLVIVAVCTEMVTINQAAPPTLAGASMTWTQIGNINDTAVGLNLALFRALSASPGSGAITITHAATPYTCQWSITEYAGVDTGGSNGADAIVQFVSNSDITGTVATVTATLSAFGSVNNGAFSAHAWFYSAPLRTASPDSGWDELHEQGSSYSGYASAVETQWRATNDTTALATWTGNGAVFVVVVELKAGAAFLARPGLPIWQAVKRAAEW